MRTQVLKAVVVCVNAIYDFINAHQRGILITALLIFGGFFTVFAAMNGGIVTTQTVDPCGSVKGALNPLFAPAAIAFVCAGMIGLTETKEETRERLYGPRHFSRIHRL